MCTGDLQTASKLLAGSDQTPVVRPKGGYRVLIEDEKSELLVFRVDMPDTRELAAFTNRGLESGA